MHIDPADIAAMREQGDLLDFLQSLTGRPPAQRKAPVEETPEPPAYHIPRPGAWPCGTAPSGPASPPCDDCRRRDGRVAHQPRKGTAA